MNSPSPISALALVATNAMKVDAENLSPYAPNYSWAFPSPSQRCDRSTGTYVVGGAVVISHPGCRRAALGAGSSPLLCTLLTPRVNSARPIP